MTVKINFVNPKRPSKRYEATEISYDELFVVVKCCNGAKMWIKTNDIQDVITYPERETYDNQEEGA